MEFDTILLSTRRARMLDQKLWHQRTINDALDACVNECPDKLALVALQVESGERTQFTYREMARMADRIAIGLSRLGVNKGDVVACQLPNGWQFTLLYLACSRIGAVMNPLMHIFRERELRFMLRHGEAKAFIAPRMFRGHDFESMAVGLKNELPHLTHFVIIGGQGDNSFEALLSTPHWEDDANAHNILARSRPAPDDVTQLIYTSGTTGEPKGVMHTANTLMANIVPYAKRLHLDHNDVVLMASPMAHQTGFMYGLMMPIMLQSRAVLQDVWDAKQATALIREQGVTFTMASTPFLTDLSRHVAADRAGIPSLRTFLSAGAPIPGPLVEQARAALGAKIISAWGMTENGAVTTTTPEDDDERSAQTDGKPLPGVEIKIADIDGTALPTGQEGKLLLRSCSNFGGYLKRPHLNTTDADDWFDTGDLARMDEQGYIRITGRTKDVIIRGGENIPVVEIESLLYRHPNVQHAAIVAYADERLGERACAMVVPRDGTSLTMEDLRAFLEKERVALQYIPEKLHILEQMPATPSGKIQKFKLRELLKREGGT